MKKILSFILAVIVVLSFGACGNNPEFGSVISDDGSDNDNGGKVIETIVPNTPETVMDMFDGERKVWFYVLDDTIKYSSPVQAVFTTEDKKILNFYYYPLNSSWEQSNQHFGISKIKDENGNSVSFNQASLYTLEDFQGLSNAEIVDKAKKEYLDASVVYQIEKRMSDSSDNSFTYATTTTTNRLPYSIKYSGSYDSSGNKFATEKIKILDCSYALYRVSDGDYSFSILCSELKYLKPLMPAIIKDKEYIGLNCTCDSKMHTFHGFNSGNVNLITQNIFNDFGELELDSPDGATTLE